MAKEKDYKEFFGNNKFSIFMVHSYGNKLLVRGRYENREPFNVVIEDFRPYFFYIDWKEKGIRDLSKIDYPLFERLEKLKIKVLNEPSEVPQVRDNPEYRLNYEADILYDMRFSIDIHSEYEKNLALNVLPRIWYIDIEVYNNHEIGIPQYRSIRKEKYINAISIYDNYNDEVITIINTEGIKDKDKVKAIPNYVELIDKYKTKVIKVSNEIELLDKFLDLIQEYQPDVITGWNVLNFDIPYIFGRIYLHNDKDTNNLLKKYGYFTNYFLSRTNQFFGSIENNQYVSFSSNEEVKLTKIFPTGIAILDYQIIYKNMVNPKKPQYSLDFIVKEELGSEYGKVEYEGSLDSLYENNPELFIKYNATDTLLVYYIDKKNQFLGIYNELKNLSGISIEYFQQDYTNKMLTGIFIRHLRKYGCALRSRKNKEERKYEGAYVRPPRTGVWEWIVDLDASSLYPSAILSLNISGDTFLFKIDESKELIEKIRYYLIFNEDKFGISDKEIKIATQKFDFENNKFIFEIKKTTPKKLLKYLQEKTNGKFTIAPNGAIFHTLNNGIIPDLQKELIKIRKQYKDNMIKLSILKNVIKEIIEKKN